MNPQHSKAASAMSGHPGPLIEVIYAPLVGGSEMLAFTLAQYWRSRGVPVRICCLYETRGPLTELFERAGIPYDLMDFGDKSMSLRWLVLARYFRRWRPRAIHAHHIGSLINVLPPARLVGCHDIVYTEHSSQDIVRAPWIRHAAPWMARFVTKITCVSDTLRKFLQEFGIPEDKMTTIYNGVDLARFHPPAPAEASPAAAAAGMRIGAVGRLVEEKDYPNLLRALALLKQRGFKFEAQIVGDGPLEAMLKRLAQELDVADVVSFAGGRADIPEFLRSLDVYVLSSQREGLPIALLEAMASGLPIVATRVDAVPEALRHEVNGLLVPKADTEALAQALQRLLEDAALRRQLGMHALRDARALFSLTQVTEAYAYYLGISTVPSLDSVA